MDQDVQTQGQFGFWGKNNTEQTEYVTVHYSLKDSAGNSESSSDSVRYDPGESKTWSRPLTMWKRYSQPGMVQVTAELDCGTSDVCNTGSFEVRPKH